MCLYALACAAFFSRAARNGSTWPPAPSPGSAFQPRTKATGFPGRDVGGAARRCLRQWGPESGRLLPGRGDKHIFFFNLLFTSRRMILVGSGGIWWDLVGSGGIWWWDHLIPPDPGSWWNLWWNHLIPRTSPNPHVWRSIGGSLWNQRNSIEEYQRTRSIVSAAHLD
jgi:hypothetical protein